MKDTKAYYGFLLIITGICASMSRASMLGPGAPIVLGEYAEPVGVLLIAIGLLMIYMHYRKD
jgi:hypothetical protein